MSAQNEQQLLEDASTLLMFANAAARQQSPGPPSAQGPPQTTQSPSNTQPPQLKSGEAPLPSVTAHNNPQPSLQPAFTTRTPEAALNYPPYHAFDQTQAPPQSRMAYDGNGSGTVTEKVAYPNPHVKSPSSQGQIQSHHYSHSQLQAPLEKQPSGSSQIQPQQISRAPIQPPIQTGTTQSASYYKAGQYSAYLPPSLGPPMVSAASKDTKSQRGSPPHEKSQSVPVEQSIDSSNSGTASYKFPSDRSKLVPLSPKPPSTSGNASVAQNLNLSPRFSALPVQGSFRNSHKKAHSDGTQLRTKTPPSPALAISRGINVESGQRRNDNAVIAAAALRAAADNPLPLIFKSSSPANSESPLNSTENVSNAKTKSTIAFDASQIKTEDSVATEPEDDNKTEDELPAASTEDHLVRIEGNPNALLEATMKSRANKPAKTQDLEVKPQVPPSQAQIEVSKQVEVQAQEADVPVKTEVVQTKSVIPPLDSYKVDPDAGTIGCICGIEEDDGFTIQCDVCFRWQHCSCMGYVNSEEVPEDEYKCYFCDESKWNKFDPEFCRNATIRRLDLDKFNEPPPEKEAAPKRKPSSSGNDDKKRRKSEKDVKALERPSSEKRKSSSGISPNISAVATFEVNNKNNPLLEGGVTAEAYQNVYYRLGDYDYKTPEIKQTLLALGKALDDSSVKQVECMSSAQLKQVKFSRVILPNHLKYLQDRNELQKNKGFNKTSLRVKAYSENPKQKFVGISKIGLFITDSTTPVGGEVVIPVGTTVIEYFAEVDMWERHASNKVNQYSLWGTVKPKVAKVDIPTGGEDQVSIVLDARFVGNEARFIRKSCPSTANCIIKPIYVPHLQKFRFHVVTTRPIVLKGSSMDEELRISWEWDERHPIRKMLKMNSDGSYGEGQKFEDFSEVDRATLVSCVDTILNFVECACNTSNLNHLCSIFKVKKATSYLLRSTRKLSSLTNSTASKSREELVLPKQSKRYVSWKERLIDRDNALQASILSTENEQSQNMNEGERPGNDEKENQEGLKIEANTHMPLRKQLLARAQAPLQKYEVAEDVAVEVNVTRVPTDGIQRSVAIPLTEKILKNIKDRINDAFEPLEKTAGKTSQPFTETPAVPETKTEAPVVAVASHVDGGEASKPLVKKKLSFADYKKKMK